MEIQVLSLQAGSMNKASNRWRTFLALWPYRQYSVYVALSSKISCSEIWLGIIQTTDNITNNGICIEYPLHCAKKGQVYILKQLDFNQNIFQGLVQLGRNIGLF